MDLFQKEKYKKHYKEYYESPSLFSSGTKELNSINKKIKEELTAFDAELKLTKEISDEIWSRMTKEIKQLQSSQNEKDRRYSNILYKKLCIYLDDEYFKLKRKHDDHSVKITAAIDAKKEIENRICLNSQIRLLLFGALSLSISGVMILFT